MTPSEVHEFYGNNWANFIKETKFGVNTYQKWVKQGFIPLASQKRIEAITKGKLKAQFHSPKPWAK